MISDECWRRTSKVLHGVQDGGEAENAQHQGCPAWKRKWIEQLLDYCRLMHQQEKDKKEMRVVAECRLPRRDQH